MKFTKSNTHETSDRSFNQENANENDNHSHDIEHEKSSGRFESEASDFGSICTESAPYGGTGGDGDEIAGAESIAVFRLKLVVLSILILSAISVSYAVHGYVGDNQKTSFEGNFADGADKVFEAVGSALALSLSSVDSFVANLVAFAAYSNMTWPFVTYPKYAVTTSKVRAIAKGFVSGQYHVVGGNQREQWERYAEENKGWVEESLQTQKTDPTFRGLQLNNYTTSPVIFTNTGVQDGPPPYYPQWQNSPIVPVYPPFNWDGNGHVPLVQALPQLEQKRVVLSSVSNVPGVPGLTDENIAITNIWASGLIDPSSDVTEPFSELFFPIVDTASDSVKLEADGKLVGVFFMSFFWRNIFRDILPLGTDGIVVVVENQCNQTFTYQINGPLAVYLGNGDLHDSLFDHLGMSSTIADLRAFSSGSNSLYTGPKITNDLCSYSLRIYPSKGMHDYYNTSDPLIFSLVAFCIFLFTSIVFLMYDFLVERRQKKVMTTAVRTNAIVTSLFPPNVRDRLFPGGEQENSAFQEPNSTKHRLKTFLSDWKSNETEPKEEKKSPIADLFPETTVMFADIAGFTAWSSIRQPTQVFTLLETVYGAFDAIATRRGVFKVETIGDSYVAVVGLPERREDHAVVMAKFAIECRSKMEDLTRELETRLGPGTGDLQFRFGLHSGPVTAGVLRGQKSRFQLFGDTVNTASRMESTCSRNCIQVSLATANLLIHARKNHWLKPREELVEIKGKGTMRTFWLEPRTRTNSITTSAGGKGTYKLDEKTNRFVDWYVETLSTLIRQIIARHNVTRNGKHSVMVESEPFSSGALNGIDEVQDKIEMPAFDERACRLQDPQTIELSAAVTEQLREYVMAIAAMYQENPFHNFEHACHVGMSVAKLLGRIVGPDHDLRDQWKHLAASLHEHSCGIATDPLTQFACVFSALIHDVDHPGVSNSQLVKENSELAVYYNGKSVAEQNSLSLSWKLLNTSAYNDLRAAICPTKQEKIRFRHLVVSSVMATDILDKDLKQRRNARWDQVFNSTNTCSRSKDAARDQMNRRAMILIEHLIQASDVAHTMQHWHVYIKWNERFFHECYNGFLNGRADTNPVLTWYQGELGFFDFYIIPLAKKLKDCEAFGVASDEYLNYAEANRREWEAKGKDIVAGYVSRASQNMDGTKNLN